MTASMQISTFLFNNIVPSSMTGHVRMFFLVSDLNTSRFLGSGGLYRDIHHLPIKGLPFELCSDFFPPQAKSLTSGFSMHQLWNVGGGIQPGSSLTGLACSQRGPEASAQEIPLPLPWLLLASPVLHPSLPFQQLVSG